MDPRPKFKTNRLILRPFLIEDASDIQRLASDIDIARNAVNIPHPYQDGVAETWISKQLEEFEKGVSSMWAITLSDSGTLIGSIGLSINEQNDNAELGYWIGKDYWNNGYCTEAVREILKYCFEDMVLNKVYAHHIEENTASGQVLINNGFKQEGKLRRHIYSFGDYKTLVLYGILRSDYNM